MHCLCRDRSPLDFLKVVGQLRGCINLARGKKLSRMAQINRREDLRVSSSGFLQVWVMFFVNIADCISADVCLVINRVSRMV